MRIMQSVTLTDNQKRVLAKIAASPTPKVAGAEVSQDQNLIAAREQLTKLGAITFFAGEAELTDKGQQLAKDENVVDDTGALTPDGEQLAHTDPEGRKEVDTGAVPPPATPTPGGAQPPAVPAGGDLAAQLGMESVQYESMDLLKELLNW